MPGDGWWAGDAASSQRGEELTRLSLTLSLAKLPLDESSRQQAAHEMELVITYYCKCRNLRYSPACGWPELLLVLSSLHMSRVDLFNCFYSLAAKYIPRYRHRHSSEPQRPGYVARHRRGHRCACPQSSHIAAL